MKVVVAAASRVHTPKRLRHGILRGAVTLIQILLASVSLSIFAKPVLLFPSDTFSFLRRSTLFICETKKIKCLLEVQMPLSVSS